ncbi:MAG: CHRD domain-containing protein, partial [Ginsengibacter sp.]
MKKNYLNFQLLFFAFVFVLLFGSSAKAAIYPIFANYSGLQEVAPNASTGKGVIAGWYNDATKTISFTIIFGNLTAPTVAAHFHAPAPPGVNAGVIFGYTGFPTGVVQGSYSNSFVITSLQESQLFGGMWYSNIHTAAFPGGEIRAQITLGNPATQYIINNTYSGTQEVPPNASPATGRIIGSYNTVSKTISYGIIFSGLTAPAAAAHFHAPAPPGVNASVIIGLAGFPAATSGTYFNSNILNPVQDTWLLSNLFYANIHNSSFPGGEIRAQI